MSELFTGGLWLAAALLLGIADELYRARRLRVGDSDEGARRVATLSKAGAFVARLVPSSEPPAITPEENAGGAQGRDTTTDVGYRERRGPGSAMGGARPLSVWGER